MTVWVGIVTLLLIVVTVALIGLILIQRGKGGGLAGAFGGGGVEQAFGTHATTLAQKATWVLGALFMALTVILGIIWQRPVMVTAPQTPAATMPATPAAAPTAPGAAAPAKDNKAASTATPGAPAKATSAPAQAPAATPAPAKAAPAAPAKATPAAPAAPAKETK